MIIHSNFKLNGVSYDKETLSFWAKNKIIEGYDYEKIIGEFILQWFNPDSDLQVQTSGTTGVAKQIALKKQAMVYSAQSTGAFFRLNEDTKALCCLPVKYIAGKMMLVRAMVLGWDLTLVEPSSSPLENASMEYDFAAMVPLQVEQSLNKLSKIKILLIGGAKVNAILTEKLLQRAINAYESYSMTETITHIALKKIGTKSFKILPGIVINQDGRGCLVIDAPNINNNLLITNDLVDLVSESEFIWKGRIDNVINSGGIKLFPEQIESKLIHKIKQRFFICGLLDERLGEKLVLIVEGLNDQINSSVFNELSIYEVPKQVIFIPKFEETETGKIKRKETILKYTAPK
ncbi:AMP-binding protein [Flavobacterium oreochromis]|uniref:O-succinylbenzoic acid--CoA ligase n=3 Tax=Flavobacterium TaxID=237 RepID=A0A246GAY4_9FLAO|nr:AMP-binding protein [Flavobacterium oreochromis]OWP75577.1 O-succinylbenzoic acid--CoA ligase [Flavobacterium oreochromis]OWP77408.1 O-succinylbenzoic acid--CoA ligase [Flavobacterium oreochromis]POR26338.1 O-succinylbenzoic acid--CoA ligase [Flavobacterium columnare]